MMDLCAPCLPSKLGRRASNPNVKPTELYDEAECNRAIAEAKGMLRQMEAMGR